MFPERTSVTSSTIQLTVVKLFPSLQSPRSEPPFYPINSFPHLVTNREREVKSTDASVFGGRVKSPFPAFTPSNIFNVMLKMKTAKTYKVPGLGPVYDNSLNSSIRTIEGLEQSKLCGLRGKRKI